MQPYTVKVDNGHPHSVPKITLEPWTPPVPTAYLCLWKGQPLDLPGVYCPPFEIVPDPSSAFGFFQDRLPKEAAAALSWWQEDMNVPGEVAVMRHKGEIIGWVVSLARTVR